MKSRHKESAHFSFRTGAETGDTTLTDSNNENATDVSWQLIAVDELPDADATHLVLPLTLWLSNKADYQGRTDIAIWLDSADEPEQLAGDLHHFSFVALDFPVFKDGRPYSAAHVLRNQLGYRGELRAIGDVRRDQLEQMSRCGFDKFCLPDGTILTPLDITHFSYHYQTAADNKGPLFKTHSLN
jgi:uncharacterized protein (DUF934 family)